LKILNSRRYGGNETGNVIADVIYGKVNPSGRSPLSFPKREQDIAAHLNFKSAKGRVVYEEGIWVGYKHFNARGIEPLFPFGCVEQVYAATFPDEL
jgi:beta-glucosidase